MISLDDATHTYTLDATGEVIPSVTQALSVINNLDHIPFEVLERARIFGVHCHSMVDLFNKGELDEDDLDPELRRYLFQYKRFLHESRFTIVQSEQLVFHNVLKYAGKLDSIGTRSRQRWLIDLKSGAIPCTVGPQTAGYANAHHEPTLRRAVLQLQRDRYVFKPLESPTDFSNFLSALNCFKFYKRHHRGNDRNGYQEKATG